MNNDEVFSVLKEKNIHKVEVKFSGGNDEGGTDEIVALDKDGKEFKFNPYGNWNSETRKYEQDGIFDGNLIEALSRPVYDRYGTFAGDFNVYGTLIWDVKTGTARIQGEESVQTYEPFADPIL